MRRNPDNAADRRRSRSAAASPGTPPTGAVPRRRSRPTGSARTAAAGAAAVSGLVRQSIV